MHHNFQSFFKEAMENESHCVSKVANDKQIANGQVKKEACKCEDCRGGKVDDNCDCEQCQAVCVIKEVPKNNQQKAGIVLGTGIGVAEAAQNHSIESNGPVCKQEVSQIDSMHNEVLCFQFNNETNKGTPVQCISYSGTLGRSSRAPRAKVNYAVVTQEEDMAEGDPDYEPEDGKDADGHSASGSAERMKTTGARGQLVNSQSSRGNEIGKKCTSHQPIQSILFHCPVKECGKHFSKKTSLSKHSRIHGPLYNIDFIVFERKNASSGETQVLVKFESYPNPEWHPLGKGTFQINPDGLAMRRFRSHLRAYQEWLENGEDMAMIRETIQREIKKLPKKMAKCIITGLEAYARLNQFASQVTMDDQGFAFKWHFYVFNILSFLEKEKEEKDRPIEDVEKDEGMVASELHQLVQITGKIDFDL